MVESEAASEVSYAFLELETEYGASAGWGPSIGSAHELWQDSEEVCAGPVMTTLTSLAWPLDISESEDACIGPMVTTLTSLVWPLDLSDEPELQKFMPREVDARCEVG